MKVFILSVFVTLVITLPVASSGPVKYKTLDKKRWTLTESPNFRIVSDVKPKKVRKVIEELERFRAFSELLMGIKVSTTKEKSLLTLTKNRMTWKALGLPNSAVSYTWAHAQQGTQIFADVNGLSSTSLEQINSGRATIFHALAFQLFQEASVYQRVPFWYSQGFARYLSGYNESKDVVAIGGLDAMRGRLRILFSANGHFKPVNIIDVMSRKSYKQKVTGEELSRQKRMRFDAQAFVIVHYFYADDARRKQLSDFIGTMKSGKSTETRMVEAFGQTPEELSSEITKYAISGTKAIAYNRDQIESILKLPTDEKYQQSSLSPQAFWPIVYPAIINLSDEVLPYKHKKALYETVKQYLPKTKYVFDDS